MSAVRVGVTGATGLLGTALVQHLAASGSIPVRLVRRTHERGAGDVYWDPSRGVLDPADVEGLDALVHLAGASIGRRWTRARLRAIRDSRIQSTNLLSRVITRMNRPPGVFVCASAVGYYGDRGDEWLDESSVHGDGILAELAVDWEAACGPIRDRGVRVVNARFGVLLSPRGGALQRLLPPFRLGLGGRLGRGAQWMSWIALSDCVRALSHILAAAPVHGPVNVVAPSPVTNGDFSRTLGRVLGRPALFHVPAFALRLIFGRMADETLLASQRVNPAGLRESGFEWRHPELESALRSELGR